MGGQWRHSKLMGLRLGGDARQGYLQNGCLWGRLCCVLLKLRPPAPRVGADDPAAIKVAPATSVSGQRRHSMSTLSRCVCASCVLGNVPLSAARSGSSATRVARASDSGGGLRGEDVGCWLSLSL
jgi:hypothetical protein